MHMQEKMRIRDCLQWQLRLQGQSLVGDIPHRAGLDLSGPVRGKVIRAQPITVFLTLSIFLRNIISLCL